MSAARKAEIDLADGAQVTVVITGGVKTGKTTIGEIIEQALAEKGFEVSFEPADGSFPSISLSERVERLKDKIYVKVVERQVNRGTPVR